MASKHAFFLLKYFIWWRIHYVGCDIAVGHKESCFKSSGYGDRVQGEGKHWSGAQVSPSAIASAGAFVNANRVMGFHFKGINSHVGG